MDITGKENQPQDRAANPLVEVAIERLSFIVIAAVSAVGLSVFHGVIPGRTTGDNNKPAAFCAARPRIDQLYDGLQLSLPKADTGFPVSLETTIQEIDI